MAISPRDFAAIAAIMQRDARIALSEAKTTLVESRLARRLRTFGLTRFSDYVALVERDADERHAMVVALTTNHTLFFREPHHFTHFEEVLLPRLRQKQGPVRIWSAGCSSGEEVYTIAMCLLGRDRAAAGWLRDRDVRLLATDIAPPVVEAVRNACYADHATKGVPEPWRSLWMQPTADGGAMVMDERARALVTANVLNLFDPWPLKAAYDAIFCRNVMIYFDDQAKEELQLRLIDQLVPGGLLYIGHSERLLGAAARAMESCGHTIYRKPERA
ncbi:protein-glutamate O-methyltransferase CheR [uncultured Sphingomonas sp.]|uniref:CheR family methyltransferase n=1 Tax=uncultured Sphingomonas sp. TaxID=158754 RepID=UPI00263902F4|nr:protein-glutamate O-methyltransferase CheR [uncultured Sphingomonas sp.]